MGELQSDDLFTLLRESVTNLILKNIHNPNTNSLFKPSEIYDRQPDLKSIKFESFPYLIVEFPQVDIAGGEGDYQTLDMKTKRYEWSMDLIIHATDRAFGTHRNYQGSDTTRRISNQLLEMFNDVRVRQFLQSKGFYFMKPVISNVLPITTISNTLVYELVFTLTFSTYTKIESNKTFQF